MLFTLPFSLLLAFTPPAAVAPMPRVVGEAVSLRTPTGTLHGTLDLPTVPGPWPVVLVHAGSGPTDRDGNQPGLKNDALKKLGSGLRERGIAVLRIDKRGIAASALTTLKESDLRLETYADDAAAWIRFLRADRRFSRVAALGHSEGSLIAMLVAKGEKVDAFVSLCGAGRPAAVILREQLNRNLPETLRTESERILVELEAGRTVKDPPAALASLFRPSVQPYLISWFRHNPAKALAELAAPVLILDGTTDIQIPTTDGDALAKAKPRATRVTLVNLNHVLRELPTTNRMVQMLNYQNAGQPLHPDLVPTIAEFLLKVEQAR